MSEAPAAPTRKQSALMRRLAKMKDHKDYPKAMEHVPPTEEGLERADSLRNRGLAELIGGAALIGLGLGVAGGLWTWVWAALGAVAAVFGLKHLFAGMGARSKHLSEPLGRVAALVSDRRSQTEMGWLEGRTTYYFQLELEDGSSKEFRYPGRGTQDDLLVKGITGVDFVRGDTLIAWKTIKV